MYRRRKIIFRIILPLMALALFSTLLTGCQSEEDKKFDALLKKLHDADANDRDHAATALGVLKDPRAVSFLADTVIRDTDPKVRLSAAT